MEAYTEIALGIL